MQIGCRIPRAALTRWLAGLVLTFPISCLLLTDGKECDTNSPFWVICGYILVVPALKINDLSGSNFCTPQGECTSNNRSPGLAGKGHCIVKTVIGTSKSSFLISFFFLLLSFLFLRGGKNQPYFCCLRHLSSGIQRGPPMLWFWSHRQGVPSLDVSVIQRRGGQNYGGEESDLIIQTDSNTFSSHSESLYNVCFFKYELLLFSVCHSAVNTPSSLLVFNFSV